MTKISDERLSENRLGEIACNRWRANGDDAICMAKELLLLRPYFEEFLKLAADLGEPDDPFAAWEALQSLRASPEPAGVRVEALAAEMLKIAEQVGEKDDPFAAWETIDLLLRRSALVSPRQEREPVAWMWLSFPEGWQFTIDKHSAPEVADPLYAALSNQQPVAVTDEMVEQAWITYVDASMSPSLTHREAMRAALEQAFPLTGPHEPAALEVKQGKEG